MMDKIYEAVVVDEELGMEETLDIYQLPVPKCPKQPVLTSFFRYDSQYHSQSHVHVINWSRRKFQFILIFCILLVDQEDFTSKSAINFTAYGVMILSIMDFT